MSSPQHIVITGSTRGIGFGLAKAFLKRGCSVTVSGRGAESTLAAVKQLSAQHDPARIFGLACDVAIPEQVSALWNESATRFGRVDMWVNNAGHSGDMAAIWDISESQAQSVIETNLMGTIFGAQVAMRGMQAQGHGAIYNMEGMGSDGRKHAGLSYYGTTKYAVHYFTESLALEAKGTHIIIGGLRPGMVATDMLRDRYKDRPEEWERVKKIFNILAEPVDKVAPALVERMLANLKNGVIISYSSPWRLLWKFLSSSFIRRRVFD